MLEKINAVPLWERLKTADKPVILYGMGDGAQKIIDVALRLGVRISGVMASDDFVRGHSFAGFEVKKLADIEKQFHDFIILLAFGTSLPEVMERITYISGRHELYAPDVPVVGGTLFDMDYAQENEDKLEAVYRSLADEQSKNVFLGWLKYRISGNINHLLENQTEKSEAYSLLSLGDSEVYADLGAYTGDTVSEFISQVGGKYQRIYALEPDGKSYMRLKRAHYMLNPLDFRTFNVGAWDKDEAKDFIQKGGRSSTLTPYDGDTPPDPSRGRIKQINMRSLDSILKGERASLIKFDVEGCESKALDGCRETIAKYKPKLIVSLYHRGEDMFELPLKIKQLHGGYRLYLRQHPYIPAWDMNLYCI